jgi:hypothetical protein
MKRRERKRVGSRHFIRRWRRRQWPDCSKRDPCVVRSRNPQQPLHYGCQTSNHLLLNIFAPSCVVFQQSKLGKSLQWIIPHYVLRFVICPTCLFSMLQYPAAWVACAVLRNTHFMRKEGGGRQQRLSIQGAADWGTNDSNENGNVLCALCQLWRLASRARRSIDKVYSRNPRITSIIHAFWL